MLSHRNVEGRLYNTWRWQFARCLAAMHHENWPLDVHRARDVRLSPGLISSRADAAALALESSAIFQTFLAPVGGDTCATDQQNYLPEPFSSSALTVSTGRRFRFLFLRRNAKGFNSRSLIVRRISRDADRTFIGHSSISNC